MCYYVGYCCNRWLSINGNKEKKVLQRNCYKRSFNCCCNEKLIAFRAIYRKLFYPYRSHYLPLHSFSMIRHPTHFLLSDTLLDSDFLLHPHFTRISLSRPLEDVLVRSLTSQHYWDIMKWAFKHATWTVCYTMTIFTEYWESKCWQIEKLIRSVLWCEKFIFSGRKKILRKIIRRFAKTSEQNIFFSA